jgi:hypothetical protein
MQKAAATKTTNLNFYDLIVSPFGDRLRIPPDRSNFSIELPDLSRNSFCRNFEKKKIGRARSHRELVRFLIAQAQVSRQSRRKRKKKVGIIRIQKFAVFNKTKTVETFVG